MDLIIKLIKFILTMAILAVALYLLGSSFGLLPSKYEPSILFASKIKATENWVAQDANSDSITSGMSKKVNDYLNKAHDTSNTDKANSTSEPLTPMEKAKQAVDQYENKMNEEKKVLDNL